MLAISPCVYTQAVLAITPCVMTQAVLAVPVRTIGEFGQQASLSIFRLKPVWEFLSDFALKFLKKVIANRKRIHTCYFEI